MKRTFLFVFALALLLPTLTAQAQTRPANEGRGDSVSPLPLHHGSFSCSLQGTTDNGDPFDILISYQENIRGEIIQAAIFRWEVAWFLNAFWSWHAYGVNIEVRQWGKSYRRRCYASARY